MSVVLDPISRLKRDQKVAATTLGQLEARYLVDTYYQMQRNRITADNQIRAASTSEEPHSILMWYSSNSHALEDQIKSALKVFAESHPAGRWAMEQKGIGPVIASGFLSRLELRPTVGAWWRFCGMDPTSVWNKGQKRPWNAHLKRLCFITGDCFMKVSNLDDAYYGHIYRKRKELEVYRNEKLMFAEEAQKTLAAKKFGDNPTRKIYEKGMLPPGRINLRAQRYAVKLFLSHLHEIWYVAENGTKPPLPYAIAYLGHPVESYIPPN
jgi:hypothetical protein